jgi:3-oxoadipate enol-lactonase
MLKRTPVEGYIGGCLAVRDADLAADARRITCPTLVIAGTEDVVTPPEVGRSLAAAIPGARFESVPGAGHIPSIDQPERVNRLLWDLFANAGF